MRSEQQKFSSKGLLAVAVALSAPAFSQDPQAKQDLDLPLEEVIVTALKRNGLNIIDAPASIAVIDGTAIEKMGADQLEDFLQFAPGVSIDEAASGVLAGGTTSIQIRGVSATFGAASVGFYLDDLPFSFINFNLLPDPSPFDLRSVEVLKGPQGTLYGAGSSAGVVLVNTNDPVLNEYSGKIDVQGSNTVSGDTSASVSGAINIPILEDVLAARAVISYQDNGGYIDDFGTGEKDLNDAQRLNARVKVLFTPNEDLEVKLIGAISRIDQGLANDISDDNTNVDIISFPTQGFPQGAEANYDQFGALITYDTQWFTIRNSLSYIDYDNYTIDTRPNVAIAASFDIQSTVNELRINSNTNGPLSWVAGFFYRVTDQVFKQDLSQFGPAVGLPPGFNLDDTTTSDQYSIFGEGTYKLDQFEIGIGGSYINDETESKTDLSPIAEIPTIEPSTSEFLLQANIAYHPSEDSTIYFRYAEGLRVAVPNFGLSTLLSEPILGSGGVVDQEDSTSFELGLKGRYFESQLYAEFALFTTDIDGLQQSASFPFNGSNLNTVLNISGSAKSQGAEWLLDYSPNAVGGLNLTFSGSYIEAQIEQDEFFNGTLIFAAGTPLNLTPELILAAQASYSWDFADNWEATVSGNIQYTDGRPLTVVSQASIVGDDLLKADLRMDLSKDNYTLYAFVNNVSNENGIVTPNTGRAFAEAFGATYSSELGSRYRPRTFGAGVRYSF